MCFFTEKLSLFRCSLRRAWINRRALEPMLKNVPAHLENSFELIDIQAGDLNTNKPLPYPCNFDVISLYTSIRIQEAVDNAVSRIANSISISPDKMSQTFSLSRSTTCTSPLKIKYSAKQKAYPWAPAYQAS